jgi:hypothetical protein
MAIPTGRTTVDVSCGDACTVVSATIHRLTNVRNACGMLLKAIASSSRQKTPALSNVEPGVRSA